MLNAPKRSRLSTILPSRMPLPQRAAYNGLQRKLVIAFDIGTTFSGVSYVFLIPRGIPEIHGVTQFPGQVACGDSKIPSIVCYNKHGNVIAVGSEADVESNPELLEVEGLVRAQWFKLHLRPPHLVAEQGLNDKDIPALPCDKTATDIIGDLLRYMYQSTLQYIRERQGNEMLKSVENNIEFILSHPNGWEGKQQSEMRFAAIKAGLVDPSEAKERISFVTEGEASLHFCFSKVPDTFEKYAKDGILVVDCGGGTVDISSYALSRATTISALSDATNVLGSKFKEIAPAECLFQGSFFVTRRAQRFLSDKLHGSTFGTKKDIEAMTKYFDRVTKAIFKGLSKLHFIPFGRNENDLEHDIRSGSISLHGTDIAKFYEPAMKGITDTIEKHVRKIRIKAIFMVGGFATSHYLFSKLESHFKSKGVDVLRPDGYLNKAVAEGAIMFKIDHLVSSRVSKYAYGTSHSTAFDPNRADHLIRKDTCYEDPSGEIRIPNCFDIILKKGIETKEKKEFRASYVLDLSGPQFQSLRTWSGRIKCCRSHKHDAPIWTDIDPARFVDLCEVTADFTGVKNSIKPQYNRHGSKYYQLHFDTILLFGLTELKAQIAWIENGEEKRGPASIIYDPGQSNL